MKSVKKLSFFSVGLVLVLGLFIFAAVPAKATHQVGYRCENVCIVVVHPTTHFASVVDCCGGSVSSTRIRHDRIFTFWN